MLPDTLSKITNDFPFISSLCIVINRGDIVFLLENINQQGSHCAFICASIKLKAVGIYSLHSLQNRFETVVYLVAFARTIQIFYSAFL